MKFLRITSIKADGGECDLTRYGNPPSWTVTYACGHSATKPHSADLSIKSMFLRKNSETYLTGVCRDCSP